MADLTNKLQQIYYNLLSEFTKLELDKEQIFAKMTEMVLDNFNASFIAFYLYDVRDDCYHLESDSALTDTYVLRQSIRNTSFNMESIFKEFPTEENQFPLYFIPLERALLVISTKDTITNKLNEDIIVETEKFLTIISNILEERTNNRNHQFLFDLSTRLFSENEKNKILTEIVEALHTLYPDFSYSLLLSQDNEAIASLPIKTIEFNDTETNTVISQAFMTGQFQMENHVEEKSTYVYAPLVGKQGVYGVLQMITPSIMTFSNSEIDFINQFSFLAGTAIERATLYENSKLKVNSLSLINDFTQKLNSNLELSEIIKLVKKEIIKVSQPSEVGFIFVDDDLDVQFLGESTMYFKSEEGLTFAKNLCLETMDDPESLFVGQYDRDITFTYKSMMAIPIKHSGYVHGLTIILHEESYYFTFENFKLLETLIQHATLALTNAHLKDKLHKAVITDYLTGLHSRNYLEQKINEDMDTGEKGVLLLFDIDDFKKVNDVYGHHVGDRVIKQISDILKNYCRSMDVPARWGGEELAIYLPNRTLKESEEVAEIIRNQVSTLTDPPVTLSCGISSWVRGEKNSIINLFMRTDKALYKAKNTGKNCIVKN
ncbi:sensor domain-containing diguanylate cyclase [Oceanobacillus salinisoli]|uniref:sensor domain-containing diguanylate cyclase n=1 Tax=Oceanobacillus salinisoli TaxID=2678611 RepID=UPI0018CC3834|nr:diguanylate cyclase [Oceanobacillus salinisoli]